MMTGNAIIQIVQDHMEGKEILCRPLTYYCTAWSKATIPVWNFAAFEYKAKPQPIVCFVNEYSSYTGNTYKTSEEAVINAHTDAIRTAVKMVEADD